jgi:hypothetical protein
MRLAGFTTVGYNRAMDAEDAALLSRARLRAAELREKLEGHRRELSAASEGRRLMDRAVDSVRRVADQLGDGVEVQSP